MSLSGALEEEDWCRDPDSTMEADDLLNGSWSEKFATPHSARLDRVLARADSGRKKVKRQLSLDVDEDSCPVGSPKKAGPRGRYRAKNGVVQFTAPGLKLFTPEAGLAFYYCGQLHLEKTFGYSGKARLLKCCPATVVEGILSDPLVTAKYLYPSLGTSHIIQTQKDFENVVDFLFYSAMACYENLLTREILEKCVIDLLTTYGYKWELSNGHLVSWLVNCGAQPALLYREGVEPHLCLAALSAAREPVPLCYLLSRGLKFLKDIIRLFPKRHGFASNDKSCMSAVWILFLASQDSAVVKDRSVSYLVANILDHIFTSLPDPSTSQSVVEKVAVMLTQGLRPVYLLPACLNWDYHTLPPHFKILGLNHPHNMLFSLSVLPSSALGNRLRSLVGFLNVQLILGVPDRLVVPDHVGLAQLARLLHEASPSQWRHLLRSLYTMNVLVGLVDQLYLWGGPPVRWGTRAYGALVSLLKRFHTFKSTLPTDDSLNLDSVVVRRNIEEILNRWQQDLSREDHRHQLFGRLAAERGEA